MTQTASATVTGAGPIVVVDDDDTDRYLIGRAHRQAGVANALLTFDSGAEFLAYLHDLDVTQDALPAIVLLDINMPRMNGFGVLDELRNHQMFKDVLVVVFYTNSDHPKDQARAQDAGCRLQEKFMRAADGADFIRSLVA